LTGSELPRDPPKEIASVRSIVSAWARDGLLLAGLTTGAILVHGYHYCIEDMAHYLPAIKKLLDPALYPYDANFFLLFIQGTIFHSAVAESARLTHLPLEWVIFIWHVASIFLVLLGCLMVSRRCFREPAAQWSAVALVAALLTLPVAGTALFVIDQHLHPRTIATAFLLFALAATLDRRPLALLWLFLAGLFHPTMAMYGAVHLAFQAWVSPLPQSAALLPATPLTASANSIWHAVLARRRYPYPFLWTWYEWLGALAPIAILFSYARIGRKNDSPMMAHVSRRLAEATAFGVLVAVIATSLPGSLARFEPMRILHLTYLLFILLTGGLLGRYVLRSHALRWAILFVPLCAGMFYAQRVEFAGNAHVAWPGRAATNPWVEAFDWVRQHTPRNALFALDPRYMERPGEGFQGFRGLAERSMLADGTKDPPVAFPDLAYQWKLEVAGREHWNRFGPADFARLRKVYGVTWVVVETPSLAGLDCPYRNRAVAVCRTPETR
jgi:hypothetical protein